MEKIASGLQQPGKLDSTLIVINELLMEKSLITCIAFRLIFIPGRDFSGALLVQRIIYCRNLRPSASQRSRASRFESLIDRAKAVKMNILS